MSDVRKALTLEELEAIATVGRLIAKARKDERARVRERVAPVLAAHEPVLGGSTGDGGGYYGHIARCKCGAGRRFHVMTVASWQAHVLDALLAALPDEAAP